MLKRTCCFVASLAGGAPLFYAGYHGASDGALLMAASSFAIAYPLFPVKAQRALRDLYHKLSKN